MTQEAVRYEGDGLLQLRHGGPLQLFSATEWSHLQQGEARHMLCDRLCNVHKKVSKKHFRLSHNVLDDALAGHRCPRVVDGVLSVVREGHLSLSTSSLCKDQRIAYRMLEYRTLVDVVVELLEARARVVQLR